MWSGARDKWLRLPQISPDKAFCLLQELEKPPRNPKQMLACANGGYSVSSLPFELLNQRGLR
jgi:hypothetical protein